MSVSTAIGIIVVILFVLFVVIALVWTSATGASDRTLWTVGKLAVSPLWFLAVLVGLTVLRSKTNRRSEGSCPSRPRSSSSDSAATTGPWKPACT